MKSTKRIEMIMGIAVYFIFLTTSFASAEILDKSEHWKNFVAIYGWVPAINGDVKVKGVDANVDITYSDVISNMKFGIMGHYEGFMGHWGIMADGIYGQLEKDQEHPGGAIPGKRQFKATLSLAELAVPYRMTWNPVVADVFVGGRFNYLYTEIGIPSIPLKVDGTKQFVDPFVGGRILIPLSKSWFLGLRGDIGGFGIGDCSDLALNGNASINWQINDLVSLHGGYRAYYLKKNQADFQWEGTMHGPWLGVGFSF
jgi:hypothetical protein